MPRKRINDGVVISRFKAYDKEGNFVEVVALTNDRKRWYEDRGWTFKRTQLRVGDRGGSRSD